MEGKAVFLATAGNCSIPAQGRIPALYLPVALLRGRRNGAGQRVRRRTGAHSTKKRVGVKQRALSWRRDFYAACPAR